MKSTLHVQRFKLSSESTSGNIGSSRSGNRPVYCTLSLPNYARGRALAKHVIKLSKPDVGSQVTLVSSWMG